MDNICVSVAGKWFCREGEQRVGWVVVVVVCGGGVRQILQAKSPAGGGGGGVKKVRQRANCVAALAFKKTVP